MNNAKVLGITITAPRDREIDIARSGNIPDEQKLVAFINTNSNDQFFVIVRF